MPPAAPAPRRWFVRAGDDEKGPFDRETLERSLRDGYLKPATLVRAENEQVWRPASEVIRVGALPVSRKPKKRSKPTRYMYKLGVDGRRVRGPVTLERLSQLRPSEKRVAFVRPERGTDWMAYTRLTARNLDDDVRSNEWLSDVSRAAIQRITGGTLMLAVGIGLSWVSSHIFLGLVAGGVVLVGRAAYRWIDGRI